MTNPDLVHDFGMTFFFNFQISVNQCEGIEMGFYHDSYLTGSPV